MQYAIAKGVGLSLVGSEMRPSCEFPVEILASPLAFDQAIVALRCEARGL